MDINTIFGIISFILLYFSFKVFFFMQTKKSIVKKLFSLLVLFVAGLFTPILYIFIINPNLSPELVGQISFYLMGWFVAVFVLIKYLKLEFLRQRTKTNKIKLLLAIIVPIIFLILGFVFL